MADQQLLCAKCNKSGKRDLLLKCADCDSLFHTECCSVGSEESLRKLTARQKGAWKCDNCKTETASGRSARSDTSEVSEHATVVGMFQALNKEIKDGRKETRTRFDGLEKSMEGVASSIAEFQNRISNLEDENRQLMDRCGTLEGSLGQAMRNFAALRRDLQDTQQYMRRDNIEVKGIPQTNQEDVYKILECIAGILQIRFDRGDISVAHRVPGKDGPPIIAKFISRQTRGLWLSAAKGKRLVASQVHQRFGNNPVFINGHLTGYNKHLLGVAKQMVKDRKLVAAWCLDDGRILVRKTEGGKSTRIWSEEELDRLVGLVTSNE